MGFPKPGLKTGHALALCAGALLTLAFAPFGFWPLTLLLPLLLWWLLIGQSFTQSLIRGWLFGLGFFGTGVSWVYVSIHVHSATPAPIAVIMTLAFVSALAVFFAVQAGLWQRFFAGRFGLLNWAALWVGFEALRSYLFSGFPWLLLGTAHLHSPLAGWAPITGVFGVSALALLLSGLLFNGFKPAQTRLVRTACFSLSLFLLFAGWGLTQQTWTQAEGEPLTAGLVQGNIPQANKWNPAYRQGIIQTYRSLSTEAGAVDLLIWPETALPLFPDSAKPLLEAIAQSGELGLITGLASPSARAGRHHNSLITAGKAQGTYHKVQLVPFGEYLPLEDQLRGLVDFFNLPMSTFIPGPLHPAHLTSHGTRIAPLICYEVAYPDFSARQAKASHWLLTVSNDAWFGRSIGPLQHLQIAQFRALETQRPMLRATNNGVTAFINHRGQIEKRLPQFEAGVLTGSFQPRSGMTPFMHTGSWPIWLGVMFWLAWRLHAQSLSRRSGE